jgi:hypothetical protein
VPSPAMWARYASFFSSRLRNKDRRKQVNKPGHCDSGICTVVTIGPRASARLCRWLPSGVNLKGIK